MKQISENGGTSEQIVKDILRAIRKQYSAEKKSVLCWMGYAANTSSLNCAGVRALPRASITLGRKSFWRLANAG